jgi:hypothetical protein
MLSWRKSSFSSSPQGDCVELAWRKSSFSKTSEGDCVEVSSALPSLLVRDSKNPTGPVLRLPFTQWGSFLSRVKP